jgi:hypothetical protein
MSSDATDQLLGRDPCPTDTGPGWRAAAEAGIDMALLEHSLRLTPWERLVENQRALSLVLALEESGRRLRERSAESG